MLKYSRIVIWDSRFFDSVAVRMWISFFGVEIRFLGEISNIDFPSHTKITKMK